MPYPSPIDFNAFLEQIGDHLKGNLPFAAYRLPGNDAVFGVLQEDTALRTPKNSEQPGFVFAPYDPNAYTTLFLPADTVLKSKFPAAKFDFAKPNLPKDEASRAKHIQLVNQAIEAIDTGVLQKVVLARSVSVPLEVSPLEAFQKVLERYSGAFCYLFYHSQAGVWLGASPELLLSHSGNTAHTVSLAGTLPALDEQPPTWSPKEIWEQQVVTDYICSRLRDQGLQPEADLATAVRAGQMWHLRTPISVQVTAKKRKALIEALHPTPAVCGFPLQEAKAFIAGHERLDRSYYTGFLGPSGLHGTGNLELYVNLRCAQLMDKEAQLFVGGGITAGSDAEKEWEETRNKTGTIMAVVNKSELE